MNNYEKSFNPLVSIIIPNFNRADVIRQTLESILNQTYDHWEVIIVDDGSKDASFEIIKEFELKSNKIRGLIRNREPKGPSVCRNIGAQLANGKYLIFLDSDDILAEFCLDKRIKYISSNPKLNFVVFNIVEFYQVPGDYDVIYNTHCNDLSSYLNLFLNNTIPWQTSCPLWEKDFFLRTGGFDEEMVFMEDPELHTRVLLKDNIKFDVFQCSTPDLYYRKSDVSRFKEQKFIENSIEGRIQYIKKICSLLNTFPKAKRRNLIRELRQTLINLLIRFIYPNINSYKVEFLSIVYWTKQQKLISQKDYLLIRLLGNLWQNNHTIVRFFRLKGIIRKLIDPYF